VQDKTSEVLNTLPKVFVTRNYFSSLRTTNIDADTSGTEAMPHEEAVPVKTGRPPSIVLTSATDLNILSKQLQGVVKDNFEFRSTKNGTRIITKIIANFFGSQILPRKQ
jgi:hypothetical protein